MNDVIDAVRAASPRVKAAERYVPLDDTKQKLLDELGDVSAIKVPLNRILLAIYKAPEITRGGIIRPGVVTDEDVYQGVAGLVVKMGPHCYEQTANMDYEWTEDDICHVGDWVMFRRGEGFRVRVGKCECIMMADERGIKMVLPAPDAVF